jgi:hypothetical protein
MTIFTPDESKVERERLILEFEEYCPNGLRTDVDTYRALLIVLDYVGKVSKEPVHSEIDDAWTALVEWAGA